MLLNYEGWSDSQTPIHHSQPQPHPPPQSYKQARFLPKQIARVVVSCTTLAFKFHLSNFSVASISGHNWRQTELRQDEKYTETVKSFSYAFDFTCF